MEERGGRQARRYFCRCENKYQHSVNGLREGKAVEPRSSHGQAAQRMRRLHSPYNYDQSLTTLGPAAVQCTGGSRPVQMFPSSTTAEKRACAEKRPPAEHLNIARLDNLRVTCTPRPGFRARLSSSKSWPWGAHDLALSSRSDLPKHSTLLFLLLWSLKLSRKIPNKL